MTNNNDNIKKFSLQKRGYRYVYPDYSYKFSIMIYTNWKKLTLRLVRIII